MGPIVRASLGRSGPNVMFALQYVMPRRHSHVAHTPAALLALTLITALVSCETESPSPVTGPLRETLPNGAVLVRYPDLPAVDSVGPEIAEAHVDLQFGSVDGTDPNLTFGAIRVQAASDGTIYVLDQQAAEVRVFDADGRYLRTIVRQGEGPGEIGGANGIFLSGDTLLWINDTRQRTIIGVDTDGDEVRRFTKPVMSVASTWTGVFDDRGRYWREVSHSDNQPGFPPPVGLTSWTGRHYYKSHDLSSGAIDSVQLGEARFQIYSYSTPDVPFGFLPLRFEPFEMTAVHPAGGFWRAHNTSYRIARIGEGGDTLVVIEVGLPGQPVTDADRIAYVDSIVEDRPELRRQAEEVAALMPDTKPVLAELFIDDEHRLWVQRVTPDGAPAFYDLFSVDGDYVGSVRLGFAAAGPLVVRNGRIYSWVEDELGVPFVVRG
ncbi:MAG: 6-bladed beta-propeller, partial [Gemmatimonadetes bacterium]|nr:6-bladed beta-propeller [Gemmatimonadota bacterium]